MEYVAQFFRHVRWIWRVPYYILCSSRVKLTLLDVVRKMDPGYCMKIADLLNQPNPIFDDIPWMMDGHHPLVIRRGP